MALTLHGVAVVPTDNGSNTGVNVTITPPASMQAGDFVMVHSFSRTESNLTSVSTTGGQTWTVLPLTYPDGIVKSLQPGQTTGATHMNSAMCLFNGTWSADPVFAHTNQSGTDVVSVIMLVWRPTSTTNKKWRITANYETRNTTTSTGTANFLSINDTNHTLYTAPEGVSLGLGSVDNPSEGVQTGIWWSWDDNTWGTLTGTGITQSGLSSQYRNTGGSDLSFAIAYRAFDFDGSTISQVNATLTQATLGRDDMTMVTYILYQTDDTPVSPSVTPTNTPTKTPTVTPTPSSSNIFVTPTATSTITPTPTVTPTITPTITPTPTVTPEEPDHKPRKPKKDKPSFVGGRDISFIPPVEENKNKLYFSSQNDDEEVILILNMLLCQEIV